MSTLKITTQFILIINLVFGCTTPEKKDSQISFAPTLKTEFARKFQYTSDGVRVTEPWPGAKKPINYKIPEAPKRVIVTSTTHLPYLELLGVENTLVGFPNTQYVSSHKIRKLIDQGKVNDLGPDGNMNLELLIALDPDLVFAFDMGKESTTLDKIQEAGIPVIYNSDYLESSALGRAEWIKFFGTFFHREDLADSIFNAINLRYDSLKHLANQADKKPTIFSGVMYGDVWYLPGGQNWAAEFYNDAGGDYLWKEDSTGGWLEISFESVFDKAHAADYWIGTSTFNSLNELANQDKRYMEFAAFKNQKIYSYNKRISPSGGYDFFESGYARPDIVLADFIKILHPELLPDYETYYFQKLK